MSRYSAYGASDRLLHTLAFIRGGELQKILSGIEDATLARDLPDEPPARPVFVAGLPRAGTTLLLSLLAAQPEFATHTYRDMPFVLNPVLWDRLSRRFRRPARVHERAHGDGMLVGYDSPEAFEEVLWMAFWRDKYRAQHILPWLPEERDAAFERFFARHMHKVIAVRACGDGRAGRYLSKNNANIARLALLPRMFPDCRIVVPVRDPWSHVRSLQHQHAHFSVIHAGDPFARRYMAWLGHFEFGAELRPIRFPGWSADDVHAEAMFSEFWLRYWIAAHTAILAEADSGHVILVDYTTLCASPRPMLLALAAALDVRECAVLAARADGIRPAAATAHIGARDPELIRRATELYAALRDACLDPAPRLVSDNAAQSQGNSA